MVMLTDDKNYILKMLQLRGTISALKDGLMQFHFDIKMYIHILRCCQLSTINQTLIHSPDLQ